MRNRHSEQTVSFAHFWRDQSIETTDPVNKEFLRRFPHLYTLDEMEALLRLPFGNDEGSALG